MHEEAASLYVERSGEDDGGAAVAEAPEVAKKSPSLKSRSPIRGLWFTSRDQLVTPWVSRKEAMTY
jgi:hypothetical protein